MELEATVIQLGDKQMSYAFVKVEIDFVAKAATQHSIINVLPWVYAYLQIESIGGEDGPEERQFY